MLAMNISRMVGIRKLDQDGNHVAGATLQILGHDHETVMKEFVTTDEDFFWAPSAYLNDGSSQYYLHEVSAPGGYLISEEDIPFTFELGETIEYLQIEDVNTRIMKTYKPSVVTVNGKAVEDNIIVMTDKDTDVTISKTDITGTEEIGGASLAVYRAEDILDGEPIEGKEAIDSWTSEEGKSHRIVGKLEAGGEVNAKEVARLNKKIDELQNRHAGILAHGKILYEAVSEGSTTVTWGKNDFADFIEYYKLKDLPYVNELETEYNHLSAKYMFFAILEHEGRSDDEIMRILGISDSTMRSTRSRINNKRNAGF